MASTDNNAGIKPGDQVLVYLMQHTYASRSDERVGIRFATVERVTRTQVVIEGINYHSDPYHDRCLEPAKAADREYAHTEHGEGRRRFAHPNLVKSIDWQFLLTLKDHREEYKRAQALNHRAYELLSYEHHMYLPQLLELVKDPELITSLESALDQYEQAQRNALESVSAFFARYAPTREDQ